jgi:hypothetical protein
MEFSMEDLGMFYGHLVYFITIWYILCQFGIFMVIWYSFPVLVSCTTKNLATLLENKKIRSSFLCCNVILGSENSLAASVDIFCNGDGTTFLRLQVWSSRNFL